MPELPSDDYYEDSEGTILILLEYDNVRITDPSDFYVYEDGVLTMDLDGVTQVIPKEYFNKHFRLQNIAKEA